MPRFVIRRRMREYFPGLPYNGPMKAICVFCGSRPGSFPEYEAGARALGALLAKEKIRLIYGGARVGLMGMLADGVLQNGGEAVGVIPKGLMRKEVAHHALKELHVVNSMHERKAMMADLSDGFIALPGGFGTFEEFFEILTWSQLGIHGKALGILNTRGFYDPLFKFLDQAVSTEFIDPEHRAMVLHSETPEDLLGKMRAYVPTAKPKWIREDET